MQTPIDFGKRFLNNYFALRDMDKCLEDLAYDMVWITPDGMNHFLTAKEVRDFLQEEMEANPERRIVDILSIKSSPGADHVFTVAYEVNLVPKNHEQTVNLRCSMAICKRGQHYEISFIHMSEKLVGGTIGQVREFTQYLPCGVMIFAYMKEDGLRMVFCNDYFREMLRYKEDTWQKLSERDPFFMIPENEKQELMKTLDEINGTHRNFSADVTFCRRDGKKFYHRVVGAPAFREGDNTVYYCVFQETTEFYGAHTELLRKAELSSGILRSLPGELCVFAGEERKPVYFSKTLPEMFGSDAQTVISGLQKDVLFGLEMTEITREKIRETSAGLPSANPFAGTFRVNNNEEEGRWKDFYIVHTKSPENEPLLILMYLDKDEEKREALHQLQQAENMSRMQQERAREESRLAKENAEEEIRQIRERTEEEIRVALDTAAEETDALREAHRRESDAQREAYRRETDALRKGYEKKLQELEERLASLEQERTLKTEVLPQKPVEEPEVLAEEEPVAVAVPEPDNTGDVLFMPMDILEDVCDEAEILCRDRNVKLVLGKSATLPEKVIGNAERVRQALLCILESVAAHTPPLDVITVAGRADKAAANRVIMYFTVRDERSGIAETLRTGLFDDRQGEPDPVRDSLYTAREILEPIGGTVQVRGRHGEGTVFILTVKMLLG